MGRFSEAAYCYALNELRHIFPGSVPIPYHASLILSYLKQQQVFVLIFEMFLGHPRTNIRWVIFPFIVDILYPSVDLKYQATGFNPIINDVTQKESPCNISRKISIGLINSKGLFT